MVGAMTTAGQLRFSWEDHLRALDDSAIKLECCAGVIYALAGGTLAHAELSAAAIARLRQALAPGCPVFSSDAKLRVEVSDFAGFPDASVVCGERQTSRIDANALVNPTLVVELTRAARRRTTTAARSCCTTSDCLPCARCSSCRIASAG